MSVKQAKSKSRQDVVIPVSTWRYRLVGAGFFLAFVSLVVRAAYLQVIDAEYLHEQGKARYLRVQIEHPNRGMILDRHGQPLAISTPVDSIWMVPNSLLESRRSSQLKQLATLLETSVAAIVTQAESRRGRQFEYLKRHVAPDTARQIKALGIAGVNVVREYKRFYPAGPVFGHVLGFTDIDGVGQEGVELAFESRLRGSPGRTRVLRNAAGQVVEHVERIDQVQHGESITLSLDARIQYLAYRALQTATNRHGAMNASLVALDAKSGEILAMVSAPDFNPNNRADLDSNRFRNRAIGDAYEPGSTMKPFSVAMVLEQGEYTQTSLIDAEQGRFKIGAHEISDTKKLGEISVSEVVSKSSNIGAAKLAMSQPVGKLLATYQQLGFGQSSQIGLLGEQSGLLPDRRQWRPSEHATLAYGYGLSATSLQLARAYTALTNQGELLPVSLLPQQQQQRRKKVFSKATVAAVNAMLEQAVSQAGTAPKARVDQFRVAGKTGTAHRVVKGEYQDDSYMSLFAGFAPASNPDIIMVVAINDPKSVDYYGGLVAAPVFQEVMSSALRLRNVLPDAIQVDEPVPELMITRPLQSVSAINQGGGQ